jgi:hypothetical protein
LIAITEAHCLLVTLEVLLPLGVVLPLLGVVVAVVELLLLVVLVVSVVVGT